jgi:hypothetical protein
MSKKWKKIIGDILLGMWFYANIVFISIMVALHGAGVIK